MISHKNPLLYGHLVSAVCTSCATALYILKWQGVALLELLTFAMTSLSTKFGKIINRSIQHATASVYTKCSTRWFWRKYVNFQYNPCCCQKARLLVSIYGPYANTPLYKNQEDNRTETTTIMQMPIWFCHVTVWGQWGSSTSFLGWFSQQLTHLRKTQFVGRRDSSGRNRGFWCDWCIAINETVNG